MSTEDVSRYPVEKILIFLRKNTAFSVPEYPTTLNRYPSCMLKIDEFLKLLDIDYKDLDYEKKHKYVISTFEKLIKDNLVYDKHFYKEQRLFDSITKKKEDTKLFSKEYIFTANGLELILKIEAHNDAERRHNDTHKHNTLMRWIAGSSFLLSLVAVSVSAYLAYIANQNMQLNQQRLEIQQQQIKSLHKRVKSTGGDIVKSE
ncbi:hypothetical protein [uncultured Pseudoalteromonas sp.]|uniref:hypothetical protein n=1 Tax=uncultured Pseudoalteromonas sp. TaxID=114053 RepID=UPI0030D9F74C|tara:strand:- start:6861 stop:7469 length:609 start_codon:yes stop_codon:yes gene_type:complete